MMGAVGASTSINKVMTDSWERPAPSLALSLSLKFETFKLGAERE